MTPTPLTSAPPEPHPGWRARPLIAAFLATRPAFLTITVVGVLLGCAVAAFALRHDPRDPVSAARLAGGAAATLLLTLLAHAAANVLNDACDTDTDTVNHTRLFPFTGGSRFVQNGVFTPTELRRFAWGLIAAAALIGVALLGTIARTAPQALVPLLAIGVSGLALLWGYSAPPLRLAARGWGEAAVALAWSLVVAGAATAWGALAGTLLPLGQTLTAGLPFGLLVANILYLNQFPDAPADAAVGKRTWPARLGKGAVWGYPLLAGLAAAVHLLLVATGQWPALTLFALLPLAASIAATRTLLAFARTLPVDVRWSTITDFQPLRPAIVATLAAAHGYGLLLAGLLAVAAFGSKP